ncbi:MAG: hypothetical protein WCF04_12850 [Candidatus Nanopelagicales bacterium]
MAAALEAARSAVDALIWDRDVRQRRAEVVAESAVRGAWANAWFEGAECRLPDLRSGASLDRSPVGRLLAGAVALQAQLPDLVPVVGTAPAQALARMHSLVAVGFVPDLELGRPRSGVLADDALRIGATPPPDEVVARLAGLSRVLRSSTAPGILVAAIAHGEVAAMRPFGWGSGLVARALIRLVLAQRGVDPQMLGAPEIGLRLAGRPRYVKAVRGYAQGTPEGVATFIELVASAVCEGARSFATPAE